MDKNEKRDKNREAGSSAAGRPALVKLTAAAARAAFLFSRFREKAL